MELVELRLSVPHELEFVFHLGSRDGHLADGAGGADAGSAARALGGSIRDPFGIECLAGEFAKATFTQHWTGLLGMRPVVRDPHASGVEDSASCQGVRRPARRNQAA